MFLIINWEVSATPSILSSMERAQSRGFSETLGPSLALLAIQTVLSPNDRLDYDDGVVVRFLPSHLGCILYVAQPTYVLVERYHIYVLVHIGA